ncbi:MAG TPA: hypothetical protein VLH56_18985 [Dissulfurispiraceae bacterium]|nr:hypothetical protein [Dissulfurispiraceae bacterium]
MYVFLVFYNYAAGAYVGFNLRTAIAQVPINSDPDSYTVCLCRPGKEDEYIEKDLLTKPSMTLNEIGPFVQRLGAELLDSYVRPGSVYLSKDVPTEEKQKTWVRWRDGLATREELVEAHEANRRWKSPEELDLVETLVLNRVSTQVS